MHNEESDNLTRRRKRRILRRKGKKGVYKVQKRKARRKARRKVIRQKTVGAALLAPLLPFKKAMKKALGKKGVSTKNMKFRAIVGKFFNEFVSKKGNKKSSYDPIDETDFYNDRNFAIPLNEVDLSTPEDSDNLALTTGTISTIVSGIINLFKKAKERRQAAKDSGLSYKEAKEVIPELDLQLGKDAEDVEKKLEEKAKADKPVTDARVKKLVVYGLLLTILAALVYFISKKR